MNSLCYSTFLVAAVAASHAIAAPQVDLAYADEGISTWSFMLIDKDHKGIASHSEFATWVKEAQDALDEAEPARTVDKVFVFTQCFSGGFLDALRSKGVVNYSASSASRYWESASYMPEDPNAPVLVLVQSYFTWAWGMIFNDEAFAIDKDITQDAADALASGANKVIPSNPKAAQQRPQHLSDAGALTIGVLDRPRYAILFAGVTNGADENDLDLMVGQLLFHGYAEENIMVLFGDQELYGGKRGTKANLEWAWKTWLVDRITAQPADVLDAEVFFWAGDHGNGHGPITISVAPGAWGAFGSDVAAELNPEQSLYLAGNDANEKRWQSPFVSSVNAIALGNDYTPQPVATYLPEMRVHFTVDPDSVGRPHTDLRREVEDGRVAAADVFIQTERSNRQMIDGERSLGLEELLNADDIDALLLRDITMVTDPRNNAMNTYLFFSLEGSSTIYVWEPITQTSWVYYDFPPADFDGDGVLDPAPEELDALAIADDGVLVERKVPGDPETTVLIPVFDPAKDEFLFSVGRNETVAPWNGFDPCDILRHHPNPVGLPHVSVYQTCNDLGLVSSKDVEACEVCFPDNVNGIDVVALDVAGFRPAPCGSIPANPDLNGDGIVDGADLAMILIGWGPCANPCVCVGDLNGDGVVDGADLGLLLTAWSN